ncbi:hypothetical protein A8B75_18505 [Sphingomonadales bacterium EhC05]|nr:hypothetical protein A8B75_18505 [Sphingomonadales bacterium EhC05]
MKEIQSQPCKRVYDRADRDEPPKSLQKAFKKSDAYTFFALEECVHGSRYRFGQKMSTDFHKKMQYISMLSSYGA